MMTDLMDAQVRVRGYILSHGQAFGSDNDVIASIRITNSEYMTLSKVDLNTILDDLKTKHEKGE